MSCPPPSLSVALGLQETSLPLLSAVATLHYPPPSFTHGPVSSESLVLPAKPHPPCPWRGDKGGQENGAAMGPPSKGAADPRPWKCCAGSKRLLQVPPAREEQAACWQPCFSEKACPERAPKPAPEGLAGLGSSAHLCQGSPMPVRAPGPLHATLTLGS